MIRVFHRLRDVLPHEYCKEKAIDRLISTVSTFCTCIYVYVYYMYTVYTLDMCIVHLCQRFMQDFKFGVESVLVVMYTCTIPSCYY